MKYRHKLIVLLVTASLAPMILLVWYSHDRMSSLLYEKEMEDMSSILNPYRMRWLRALAALREAIR